MSAHIDPSGDEPTDPRPPTSGDARSLEASVSAPLRRRYLTALVSVGLLALLSQGFIQVMLAQRANDGSTIDTAGRQRMLSQQVAKLTMLIDRADTTAAARTEPHPSADLATGDAVLRPLQTRLSETVAEWTSKHNELKERAATPAIAEQFALLEPVHQQIVQAANTIADPQSTPASRAVAAEVVLENEAAFLAMMDRVVATLSDRSEAKIRTLQWIEIAILIVLLITLELEYLLVFEPAARMIRRQFASLIEQNHRLAQTDRIREANAQLQDEIVQRREIEDALRRTQDQQEAAHDDLVRAHAEVQKLSLVASRTQHPIVLVGEDQMIDWVNDSFVRTFGYRFADAVGKPLFELLRARETTREQLQEFQQALTQGRPLVRESVVRCHGGRVLWNEVTIEPLHDEFVVHLPTDDDGLGTMCIAPDVTADEIAPVLTDEESQDLAEEREDETLLIPGESGTDVGRPAPLTIVNLVDVTQRREQSDSLARAKRMAEEANQAKSRFLANMSHEIRTPLNAILGYGDLLRKKSLFPGGRTDGSGNGTGNGTGVGTGDAATGLDAATTRQYIDTIHASGKHLLGLINDVLDLSKIEAGRMEFVAEACSPYALVSEVIQVLQPRADEKQLDLSARWTTDVPETISTDSVRLRQLLFNLVGNAVKFTDRGRVEVEVTFVGLKGHASTEATTQPRLELAVIDTGPGLSENDRVRIFEPFAQGEGDATIRNSGTGLGLSISRHICEGLGGSLRVESARGLGSRFIADLEFGSHSKATHPAVWFEQQSTIELEEASGCTIRARCLDRRKLLVCEDGRTNRDLLGIMLEEAGAEVVFAENGELGVTAYLAARRQGQPFDLVLMDMQMPVLDGYEATRELRLLGCEQPIVALTAFAMRGDRDTCLQAGCSDYVTKPIDAAELFRTLLRQLQRPPEGLTTDADDDAADRSTDAADAADEADPPPLVSTLPDDLPNRDRLRTQFADELTELIDRLQTAADADDLAEVARIAHAIQGTGGTVGFDAFTEPAGQLERLTLNAGPGSAIRRRVGELVSLSSRVSAGTA